MNSVGPDPNSRVSVLLTTYNHEKFLRQSLDSVLAQQTSFPFEIVIMEDCSTDRTRDIVLEYQRAHPHMIRLMLAESNQCDNRAFMRAVAESKADYVALLDGDDYWTSPHKLQRQVDLLDRRLDCALCFHNVEIRYEDGQESIVSNSPDQKEISTTDDLLAGCFIQTCSVLLRRTSIGSFPARYGDENSADWALHTLAARNGNIVYLNEVMGAYRQHAGGFWTSRSEAEQLTRVVDFYEAAHDYVREEYRDRVVALFAAKCFELGYLDEMAGRLESAQSWYAKARGCKADLRWLKWSLRVDGGSSATLLQPPAAGVDAEVQISSPGSGKSFDVQLNQSLFRVEKDRNYVVSFRAKAAASRSAYVGFSRGVSPWDGLGLYRKIELTEQWQDFREVFTATDSERNGRVHLDLGEELPAVSVVALGVTDEASGESISAYEVIEATAETARLSEWKLRLAGGGNARFDDSEDPEAPLRVRISSPAEAVYDVQLNRPGLCVKGGEKYALQFRARSHASSRRLGVGFSQAHAPWAGLGLYEWFDLSPEWRGFWVEFTALQDETNGRIHFDLGGSTESVDLAGIVLLHLPSGNPVGHSRRSSAAPLVNAGMPQQQDTPPAGAVAFGSFRRLKPISGNWGLERGLPVDRYYIENFLRTNAAAISGRVLEIGDNTYTRRFGENRVAQSDVLHVDEGFPGATIIADLASAPHIPSDTFDCVILTQTLQLIFNVRDAIATVHRILKPGGVMLATFPGISQSYDHEWAGHWYWNFTPLSAKRLFETCFAGPAARIDCFGNVLAATSFLYGLAAEELTPAELNHYDPGYEVTIAVRAVKASVA